MKWNPFLNALAASAYVILVAFFIHHISSIRHDTPDTVLDSIGFLSLFVFSAATMAFLFFYQPFIRLLDDKRAEALSYLLKTLGIFGVITVAVLAFVSFQ